MPEPALLIWSPVSSVMFSASSELHFYCEYGITYANGDMVMSQSHIIKGYTDEAFEAL